MNLPIVFNNILLYLTTSRWRSTQKFRATQNFIKDKISGMGRYTYVKLKIKSQERKTFVLVYLSENAQKNHFLGSCDFNFILIWGAGGIFIWQSIAPWGLTLRYWCINISDNNFKVEIIVLDRKCNILFPNIKKNKKNILRS